MRARGSEGAISSSALWPSAVGLVYFQEEKKGRINKFSTNHI